MVKRGDIYFADLSPVVGSSKAEHAQFWLFKII